MFTWRGFRQFYTIRCMAAVRLEHIRKVFENGHVAVNDASFEVAAGELMVLVGPSGCGKSTLLRLIAGLESISSGMLYIDDKAVNDWPPKDRDIAMVFQSYALYPHMTVAENLAFGLKLRGMPKSEIERRVLHAAGTLEIVELLERRPRQLSGGQRQRVALGRALVREPKVFLLDEPLSNLDAQLRLTMRTEIARLHRRLGATMIYVTHDQIEAMTLGERIVVLKGGSIQQIDSPMRLYEKPANLFVAGFLGSPAMNIFRGRLETCGAPYLRIGTITLPLGAADVDATTLAAYADRELIIGVRPEDVLPKAAGSTPPAGTTFSAQIEAIESVGNEIFTYTRLGDDVLVVRCPPRSLPEPGQPLELTFAAGKMHFFDPSTERRVL